MKKYPSYSMQVVFGGTSRRGKAALTRKGLIRMRWYRLHISRSPLVKTRYLDSAVSRAGEEVLISPPDTTAHHVLHRVFTQLERFLRVRGVRISTGADIFLLCLGFRPQLTHGVWSVRTLGWLGSSPFFYF